MFWPALVVLALNIEGVATDQGLASIIADHIGGAAPMLTTFYAIVTSPYVVFPAVFFLGAALQEQMFYRGYARARFGGVNVTRVTRIQAGTSSSAFQKNGFMRKLYRRSKYGHIDYLNDLLSLERLPLVPENFLADETANGTVAQYLRIVADGDRELAERFYSQVVLPLTKESSSLQLPEGTATETPH